MTDGIYNQFFTPGQNIEQIKALTEGYFASVEAFNDLMMGVPDEGIHIAEERFLELAEQAWQIISEITIIEYLKEQGGGNQNIVQHCSHTLSHTVVSVTMPLYAFSAKEYIEKTREIEDFNVDTFARMMGDALDFLHGQGVVHNDVHPANIVFDNNFLPVLIDFGLAYMVCEEETQHAVCCKSRDEAVSNLIYKPSSVMACTADVDNWAMAMVVTEMSLRESWEDFHRQCQHKNGRDPVNGWVSKCEASFRELAGTGGDSHSGGNKRDVVVQNPGAILFPKPDDPPGGQYNENLQGWYNEDAETSSSSSSSETSSSETSSSSSSNL